MVPADGRRSIPVGRPPVDDRAVSTVFDVSLALLLISASIVVLALFQTGGHVQTEPHHADRVADSLAGVSATANYTLAPIADDSAFRTDDFPDEAFERQRYGPVTSLLGDAAVTSVRLDGARLTGEGEQFARAAEGTVRNHLTGMDVSARVVALWRPYEGATMQGTVAAGPGVPGDADVWTSTLTVDSGFPEIEDDRLETAFGADGDFDTAADLVAERIVAGYFPPEQTQLELERDRFERALAVYRYRRFEDAVDGTSGPLFDPSDPADPLSRRGANATAANDEIADALSEILESDMKDAFDEDVEPSALADAVDIGDVKITVKFWKT